MYETVIVYAQRKNNENNAGTKGYGLGVPMIMRTVSRTIDKANTVSVLILFPPDSYLLCLLQTLSRHQKGSPQKLLQQPHIRKVF